MSIWDTMLQDVKDRSEWKAPPPKNTMGGLRRGSLIDYGPFVKRHLPKGVKQVHANRYSVKVMDNYRTRQLYWGDDLEAATAIYFDWVTRRAQH